jgi:hypothetical protein
MKDKQGLSRRDFIRNSMITGGAMLLSGILPSKAGIPTFTDSKDFNFSGTDELLRGVSDIHLHAAPDSKARLGNELEFARAAHDAGYKSMLFKSNDFSSHDRAYLIRQVLPDFEVFGSLCMNRVHGEKVNTFAAEKAVNTTGNLCRCIWMPTQDAVYQNIRYHGKKEGIPVLDDNGHVLPEVVRVMEICAEANIIFATGHSSPEESITLAREAREVGVKKFVVTHANSGIWKMTYDQIKRCIDSGAWIEYSYITNLWGPGTGLPDFERMSDKEFAGFVRIAPEHSIITTDLGQVGMPHPVEGMRRCIRALLENGLSQQQVNYMVRDNPATLVGLSAI